MEEGPCLEVGDAVEVDDHVELDEVALLPAGLADEAGLAVVQERREEEAELAAKVLAAEEELRLGQLRADRPVVFKVAGVPVEAAPGFAAGPGTSLRLVDGVPFGEREGHLEAVDHFRMLQGAEDHLDHLVRRQQRRRRRQLGAGQVTQVRLLPQRLQQHGAVLGVLRDRRRRGAQDPASPEPRGHRGGDVAAAEKALDGEDRGGGYEEQKHASTL
mmetsp:Transcript_30661/g.98804  ORF Transcript_30661/g.98804 Transcript_30661/m.98804 type:complete len:216 (+) Transcript_30661:565-1212(+)